MHTTGQITRGPFDVTSGVISINGGLSSNVESLIKQEIYTNGPVVASFDGYDDLLNYQSG